MYTKIVVFTYTQFTVITVLQIMFKYILCVHPFLKDVVLFFLLAPYSNRPDLDKRKKHLDWQRKNACYRSSTLCYSEVAIH